MRTDRISSSVVVAGALGLAPQGVPAARESLCAMCGLPIAVGDLSKPFTVGPNFTDDLSLAQRGSAHICGYCVPLLSASGLLASGFGAFGADGVKPFRKWSDVTAALLHPPRPPFVMVYATAKNQHMAWRAPVNFSTQAYRIRVGLRDLLVRRDILLRAVDACRILGALCRGEAREGADAKTLPNPFVLLSSDIKDPDHGKLIRKLAELLKDGTSMERRAGELVRKLTLGETWALRFVLTPTAGRDR